MPVSRNKRKPRKSRYPNLLKAELSAYANKQEDRDELMEVLKMFYTGAAKSQIGIALALNDDGEEEAILVGIEKTLHGTEHTYPIAKVLTASAIEQYKMPTGDGSYVSQQLA